MNNKGMLSLQLAFYILILRYSLATSERKTHWSDVDTGGYTALDFALHDSHVLNANVFHAASRSCWNISRTPVQSL